MMEENLNQLKPKQIARHNRAYYAWYYLGLDVPPHQEEWYDLVFQHNREFLLSPRGHGKTMFLPRTVLEHQCLFNKNYNSLIISKTFKQAGKTLKVVQADLEKNKLILRDFGEELEDYSAVGNQVWFNLDEEENILRDATVEGNGLLGDITGGHFDFIVLDDIIDDANCLTPDSRRKVMEWVQGTIIPMLKPGGYIAGIGTRKHYDDAYQEMINSPGWYVIQQKAILQMPKSFEYVYKTIDGQQVAVGITNVVGNYKVLWPDVWSLELLLLEKKAMGSILFDREYNNDVSQLKGRLLKDFWLKRYAIHEINTNEDVKLAPPINTMTVYQGWDLAIREKETSDYIVCTTIGITPKNEIYVLDWFRDKMAFPNQVKQVKILYDEFTPERIGIETNAYQLALKQQVLSERILPIKEIESVKNKIERIILSSVNYENGLVYVPIDHPYYNAFMEEYRIFFEKGHHDDMLDSMDMAMRLVLEPKTIKFQRGLRSSVVHAR